MSCAACLTLDYGSLGQKKLYVLTQICIFSFASKYPNKIFIDINYVPMDIRIDVYQKLGIRLM